MNSGVSREWQAMQDEYNALADNETWHLVPGSSGRRRVVGASGYTRQRGSQGKLTSRKRGMSYKDLVRCLGWGTTKAHSHKQTDFIEISCTSLPCSTCIANIFIMSAAALTSIHSLKVGHGEKNRIPVIPIPHPFATLRVW